MKIITGSSIVLRHILARWLEAEVEEQAGRVRRWTVDREGAHGAIRVWACGPR